MSGPDHTPKGWLLLVVMQVVMSLAPRTLADTVARTVAACTMQPMACGSQWTLQIQAIAHRACTRAGPHHLCFTAGTLLPPTLVVRSHSCTGLAWYFGTSGPEMRRLYQTLYTDQYR